MAADVSLSWFQGVHTTWVVQPTAANGVLNHDITYNTVYDAHNHGAGKSLWKRWQHILRTLFSGAICRVVCVTVRTVILNGTISAQILSMVVRCVLV